MNWRRGLLVVLGLALMVLTASLGRWQLSRAAYKTAQQAALLERAAMPELDGATLAQPLPAAERARLQHRRIGLQGHWLPAATVYLDNRVMNRRSGFYVITPMRLTGSGQTVLVLRGWAERDPRDPAKLPPVQTPEQEVTVDGLLIPEAPAAFALGAEGKGSIRQNIDLADYRRETGLDLADLLVQQTGAPSDGLQRDWPPPNLGVERNYGYALQWFGMSALLAGLLGWFGLLQPWLRRRRSST